MPTIRIDEDVWKYLQSKSKPFEDSPNDVLRRELELGCGDSSSASGISSGERESFKPDRDYTNLRVRGYRLANKNVRCGSFKEVLLTLSNDLRLPNSATFDSVALGLRGTKRQYFARTDAALRMPERLAGNGLFVETNLNANLIVGICRALLEKLGHSVEDFVLDVE